MLISNLASFGSIMTTALYILLAVVVLLLMIMIHESGHYFIGKKLGFKINEFSIGFGKAIFKKTLKSGEVFSIRLIPLGGYCAFAGEDADDADPRAFNNQKPWKRILVQLGGVLFNFLSAIIFAFILLVGFGYNYRCVDYVMPEHIEQMEEAGKDCLMQGDVIKRVGPTADNTTELGFFSNRFDTLVSQYKIGDEFFCVVLRDGQEVTLDLMKIADPENPDNPAGMVGINASYKPYSFVDALIHCVPVTFEMSWVIISSLFNIFTGGVPLSDVGGPITTISVMAGATQTNIMNLFILLPFIAANLAIFNILPFPALDGARIVFTIIEWIRGKPVKREVEAMIHFVGICILFAFVIFVDIYHFIA